MSPFAIGFMSLVAWLWGRAVWRRRRRAKALPVLAASERAVASQHVFLVRAGVTLDDATRRAASAYARETGTEVLDLVAARLPSFRLALLLDTLDPRSYRADRAAVGFTVGDAMLVKRELLERANIAGLDVPDVVTFVRTARLLKGYAVAHCDVAVAPTLAAHALAPRELRALVRELKGPAASFSAVLGLLGVIAQFVFTPGIALVSVATMHLPMLLITLGTALSPVDRLRYLLLRIPLDTFSIVGGRTASPSASAPSAGELRAAYQTLLANGLGAFFEPPRRDCPLCRATHLRRALATTGSLQGKPGRFILSRCLDCGHIFQNPRLSRAGIEFYYRDYYDGLGWHAFDKGYAAQLPQFKQRVELVRKFGRPARWLDVGAGGGHFCCYAAGVLPDTRFDGLDFGDGITEAERRRWVERGIRGQFVSVAPALVAPEDGYDVVTMNHYLEHAAEPRAELDAARRVLSDEGLLLIEAPDPESRIGRLFGSLWLSWLQPQHLHLVSAQNLERLLREHGFLPLSWQRGEAHMAHDFFYIALQAIERLAPRVGEPWQAPATALGKFRRRIVYLLLAPLLPCAWLLDRLLSPFMRRPGWSNTYRVIARKTQSSEQRMASPGARGVDDPLPAWNAIRDLTLEAR